MQALVFLMKMRFNGWWKTMEVYGNLSSLLPNCKMVFQPNQKKHCDATNKIGTKRVECLIIII